MNVESTGFGAPAGAVITGETHGAAIGAVGKVIAPGRGVVDVDGLEIRDVACS